MCIFRKGHIVFCPAVLGTIDGTAAVTGSTPATVAHNLILKNHNPNHLIETLDFYFHHPRKVWSNN